MQKLLTLVLVAILLLPCLLAGCNKPTEKANPELTTPEETTPVETSTDVTTPEATTPEETTPSDPPTYDFSNVNENNVLKRACIITGESNSEKYAGEELAKYLRKKNVEIASDGFPIILFLDPTLDPDSFLVDTTLRTHSDSSEIPQTRLLTMRRRDRRSSRSSTGKSIISLRAQEAAEHSRVWLSILKSRTPVS